VDYEISFGVVSPEFGVLCVSSANNVGTSERLVGNWKVRVEGFSNMIACYKDAGGFVA